MDIHLSEKSQRDLERLARSNPKVERVVRTHLRRLPEIYQRDRQLKGVFAGYRRHRVGDYRILYRADPVARLILVVRIVHRKDVYDT